MIIEWGKGSRRKEKGAKCKGWQMSGSRFKGYFTDKYVLQNMKNFFELEKTEKRAIL